MTIYGIGDRVFVPGAAQFGTVETVSVPTGGLLRIAVSANEEIWARRHEVLPGAHIPKVTKCVTDGTLFFRAYTVDSHLMNLDLMPHDDGELTLQSAEYMDGVMADPVAVYGEPGRPRYRRHSCRSGANR